MPIDVWKEVFLTETGDEQLIEKFVFVVVSDIESALMEARRKVRAEVIPDAVVAWRDPVPLLAIASLYYGGEEEQQQKLKVIVVEECSKWVRDVLEALSIKYPVIVLPVNYPTGFGKIRVKDALLKASNIVKGASLKIVDVTDAPGILGAVLHRAGVRWFTIVRRKGYEVLVEKVAI